MYAVFVRLTLSPSPTTTTSNDNYYQHHYQPQPHHYHHNDLHHCSLTLSMRPVMLLSASRPMYSGHRVLLSCSKTIKCRVFQTKLLAYILHKVGKFKNITHYQSDISRESSGHNRHDEAYDKLVAGELCLPQRPHS